MSDVSTGQNLPEMSAADDAAFKAMEAQERAAAAGGGAQQQETQQQTQQQAQTQQATQQTQQKTETQQTQAPQPGAQQVEDDDPRGVLASDGKKYLPVSVHVEERKAWKGREADLQATNQQLLQQLNAALSALGRPQVQQQTQQQQAEDKPPQNPHDKELNPIQHMEWENEQLRKQVQALVDKDKNVEQRTQQQTQLQQQQSKYIDAHNAFVAKNPAYKPMYDFVVDKMIKMHTAMGYPEHVAHQMALQLEWNTVVSAMQRQQNPFTVFSNMARDLGFVAPQTQQQQQQNPDQKLQQSAQAAQAAITLSGQPGGSVAATNLQSLVSMPKEQFAANFAGDANDEKWEKLMMGM